jgi:hypothetical protein
MRARLFDEEKPHGSRGELKKARAVTPVGLRRVDQAQVDRLEDRFGIYGVVGAFAPVGGSRKRLEFFVEQGRELIAALVTFAAGRGARAQEDSGHFGLALLLDGVAHKSSILDGTMNELPAPASRPQLSRKRVWIARLLAVAADAMQIFFLPHLGIGFLSPLMDTLDVAMAVAMTALVGWHWAFLPTFVAEIVPGLGLVPTWTLAAWLATRKHS